MPAANLFVRKTEPFGHYLGYTTEDGYLVEAVFVTTEVVPEQTRGYRDKIVTLVGADAAGKITGVKVLSEFESPRYTKGFLSDESWFLRQFEEKDAGDNFILQGDIEPAVVISDQIPIYLLPNLREIADIFVLVRK